MSNARSGIIEELFRGVRYKFKRRPYIIYDLKDLAQIDIASLESLSRDNNSNKYILVIVNGFNKKIYAHPLKTKATDEVLTATKKLLKKARFKFLNVSSDKGTEFTNKKFQAFMKDSYKTNFFFCPPPIKCSLVERQIQRLKNALYKKLMLFNTFNWLQFLDETVDELNALKHSRLKLSANEITTKNQKQVFDSFYRPKMNNNVKRKLKFKIGDYVRIAQPKFIFNRSYDTRFSALPFKIINANLKYNTYRLMDHDNKIMERSYYEEELRKTNFDKDFLVHKIIKVDKKNKKALVTFVGEKLQNYYWIDLETISNPEKIQSKKKPSIKRKN